MDENYIYKQIADSIRKDIYHGVLKPGDRLPSVRQLREKWNCTPGTVQRAYSELAREGLIISHAGRGTQVAGIIPAAKAHTDETMHKAALVHRCESFLLEAMSTGCTLPEIQLAMDLAMDRWRVLEKEPRYVTREVLHFVGSDDLVLNGLAHHFFGEIVQDVILQVSFTGSLGGLMALAEGKTDLAGCHLWDPLSDTYNITYIRRLFKDKKMILVTLAHRRLGLIVRPGNPLRIKTLLDLTRPEVRFVNRQNGSGTRIWLDASLDNQLISPKTIQGYREELPTHSQVARAIAEDSADAGLGLENSAAAFGLDFVFLTRERYDLAMEPQTANRPAVKRLIDWLRGSDGKKFIAQYKGYESEYSGSLLLVS